MSKTKTKFEDKYDIFGPYQKGDGSGRKFVITINKRTGKRRTVSYPKWVYECHVGRELDPDLCTVDHWDSDINNNDINNLRLVPRAEHSADDTRRVKMVELKCAWCGKKFERSPRVVRDKAKKGKKGPLCSRRCAGIYARALQLGRVDRKIDVQKAVDSVYYKRKYASIDTIEKFASYLEEKYELE